ncbi:NnrS family protein, partial [Pseudomonadota bacterium]
MNSSSSCSRSDRRIALFELGFRPFFLFAALYSIWATLAWFAVYVVGVQLASTDMAAPAWHAHEMIYGYGTAVVAGFLLTAAQNWTGLRTLNSTPLGLLLVLWLIPRAAPYVWPAAPAGLLAIFDLAFLAMLICAVGWVVLESGNRKQFVILLLLALLLLGNGAYYLDLAGFVPGIAQKAVLSGLYALLALVLILAGRVVPFFTERGVGYPVQLMNLSWVDPANLVLFAAFWISELIDLGNTPQALLSAALFLLNAYRLWGWYTHGIWKKPLVWVLHVAYGFLTAGFLLTLLSSLAGISPYLAIHAFAYGGIGMMTLGMMSRVTLGHTGRSVQQ